MLAYLAAGGVLVVMLALAFVATRPADFRIVRSATMAASPARVFEQVNDFRQWASWSPWEKLDPEMKKDFGGAESGRGSTYAWSGNSQAGQGKMTILETRKDQFIRISLEFLKPFKATNTTEFVFEPAEGGTRVEWSMSGRRNFLMKAMCLLMDMDKLVGGDFEKGLTNMKAVVEA